MTIAAAHWWILRWSFVAGALAGVLVFTAEIGLMALHNSRGRTKKLGLGTELDGLDTSWSFTDNWVSSITVVSGVLAGLLGTSDTATSIFGKEALTMLGVGGVIAAALAAISPLVVKVFGTNLTLPTVGGTLLAAFVTLVGAIGEIVAATWALHDRAHGFAADAAVVGGVLVGALIVIYAVRSLWFYIAHDTATTPTRHHVKPDGEQIVIRDERFAVRNSLL